ncbi:argininosuccinate lyase [Kroppenstedtia sanguinis]|uniref:Argininosuccinate lyase n=1 Tax=Kroppenstedtia sanguinis TaxID=1380684 RepID=A0ABW4CC95_9BACL
MGTREEIQQRDGTVFPGKTYVDCLLKPVFNDQRDYLFKAQFQIHRAHVLMLCDQGILSAQEAGEILRGVEILAGMDPSHLHYDPRYEDLFFMVEGLLGEEIGEEAAGNMHIARSRNDMGVAMYRLVLREQLLEVIWRVQRLREALLEVGGEHLETVMPAYTHTQPAQPTTLGHYLLAVHDVTERDTRRLWSAYQTVNRSPLGAAALTTTGFKISRESVQAFLGFEELVENSYDAIAGADDLLETATALILLMTDAGRWIQELLQFCTQEFNFLQVADPYVQISSIMPQKRNPVSVEHSRSLASSAIADAQAVCTMIHNTPFGDIVDTEDDLQPHLYRAIDKSNRVLKLMTAVISTMEVNQEEMRRRAGEGWITVTELADTWVREGGLPFRRAHQIAFQVAHRAIREQRHRIEPEWLREAVEERIGKKIPFPEEKWAEICDPRYFIEVRQCRGGPHPRETRRMLKNRQERLDADRQEWERRREVLRGAEDHLQARVQQLLSQSR